MATGSGKRSVQLSKEDTWGEKELAKHMLRDKKKRPTDAQGSPKSSPKVDRSRQPAGGGGGRRTAAPHSSTASKSRTAVAVRAGEKAATSSPLSGRKAAKESGREKGRAERRGRDEVAPRREGDKAQSGSRAGEKTRSSGGAGKQRSQPERSSKDGKRVDGGRDTRRTGEATAGRREGSRVGESSRRQAKEKPSREGVGKGVREDKQGREKKLESASGTSLGEKDSGAPITDTMEEMERQQKEKPRSKKAGDGSKRIPEGATPQPMEEVRDGDEGEVEEDYEYEEEEFEEENYNDDEFEEDIQEEEEEEEESESESTGNDVIAGKSPLATNPDPSPRINLVEIMQAIDAENKELGEGGGKFAELSVETPPPAPQLEPTPAGVEASVSWGSLGSTRSQGSTRRGFVDFSTAKKKEEKERVAKITKRRGQELLSMIEFDVVAIDLFELQPLSEYAMYMRSFGAEGTRQVASQTGEDNAEAETQTEEVEQTEKWVQWPPEDLKGYGGPVAADAEEDDMVAMATSGSSAVRLTAFLKRASQVMAALLEENAVPSGQSPLRSSQSPFPFCSSHSLIRLPTQLEGCTLTSAEYSPTHPHLLMTAYSTNTHLTNPSLDSVLRGGGAVCVWSTREPSQPQHLLVCESSPVCGCFSHHKTTLVFSGNEDGSVVLWDLREPVALHTRPPGATPTSEGLVPRPSTFSTAALPHKHNHHSSIVAMTSITTSTPHSSPLTEEDDTEAIGLSFQLASLDRSGLLIIWVAVETVPHPQGSDSDLGLAPGGRVKLVWSTGIETGRSLGSGSIPVQTLCVRFHPTDTNRLFVGTDEGTILHKTRYGRRPIPSQYQSHTETHCPCDVNSLSFSPWQPDYFLAGYSNGSIALYHTTRGRAVLVGLSSSSFSNAVAHPLVTWSESTNGIAVRQVEWVWHRPGVFLVLDSDSTLYWWNLLESDVEPVQIHRRTDTRPAILSFTLSPSSSSPQPLPSLLLRLSDSSVELHQLVSAQAASSRTSTDTQTENFTNYLQTLG